MRQLSEVQQKILKNLEGCGSGATAREIANTLGYAQTTTQECLVTLTSSGLIYYKDERGVIGRPKRKYFFSSSDFSQFTTQYSWLSSLLLEHLSNTLPPEKIDELLSSIAARVSENVERELKNLSPDGRFEKLAEIMNTLGYDVTWKRSPSTNETILEAKSCVYHKVAVQFPQLCQFDIKLIENVSKKAVQLQCCIARGGKTCRFSLI